MRRFRALVMLLILGTSALFFSLILTRGGRTIRFRKALATGAGGLFRSQIPPETSDRVDARRKVVFLVSSKRSGSSFVGEYFNQHPDMFYVFEPLQQLTFYVLGGYLNNSLFESTAFDIIQGLIDCRFDKGFKSPEEWLTRRSPLCSFNQEIGRSPLCSDTGLPQMSASEIGDSLRNICLKTPDIVFKLIRIQDLQFLRPFLQNRTLNAKILYLVRDPRGTMNSRLGLDINYDLVRRTHDVSRIREVEDMCGVIANNSKYWDGPPSWLEGRLKVLRYEDIALHPRELGEVIFRFVGRNLSDRVIEWLLLSTQDKDTAENRKDHFFKTSRDSATRVTAWRDEMTWGYVVLTQKKCKKVMDLLGYLPVHSEVLLRNSSSPSLTP